MGNNLQKYADEIDSINRKLALGYESSLNFNHGYIESLFKNKLITRTQYDSLMTVYASTENEDCIYVIENGKFISYLSDDYEIEIDDLH